MAELSYKDRLILKAHERINRLKKERMTMLIRSPEWDEKNIQIESEKKYIQDIRKGGVNEH